MNDWTGPYILALHTAHEEGKEPSAWRMGPAAFAEMVRHAGENGVAITSPDAHRVDCTLLGVKVRLDIIEVDELCLGDGSAITVNKAGK